MSFYYKKLHTYPSFSLFSVQILILFALPIRKKTI